MKRDQCLNRLGLTFWLTYQAANQLNELSSSMISAESKLWAFIHFLFGFIIYESKPKIDVRLIACGFFFLMTYSCLFIQRIYLVTWTYCSAVNTMMNDDRKWARQIRKSLWHNSLGKVRDSRRNEIKTHATQRRKENSGECNWGFGSAEIAAEDWIDVCDHFLRSIIMSKKLYTHRPINELGDFFRSII